MYSNRYNDNKTLLISTSTLSNYLHHICKIIYLISLQLFHKNLPIISKNTDEIIRLVPQFKMVVNAMARPLMAAGKISLRTSQLTVNRSKHIKTFNFSYLSTVLLYEVNDKILVPVILHLSLISTTNSHHRYVQFYKFISPL